MAKEKSNKEKRLQKKLIPVNIVVCVIALVAALTLFLTPIIKVDFGKILHDDSIVELIFPEEEENNSPSDNGLEIDYIPVAKKIVKSVLNEAEGSLSISAVSALKVMTSDEKADKVLDELLFGDKALVTKLIDSLVDGLSNIFDDNDTKKAIQNTLVSALATSFINEVEDKEQAQAIVDNIQKVVDVFDKFADEKYDPDEVTTEIIDTIAGLLDDDVEMSAKDKQELADEINKMYKEALAAVGDKREDVTLEAIICVAVSNSGVLDDIDLSDLFNTESSESSVHMKPVADESGSSGSGTDAPATSYIQLLEKIGFNSEAQEELKSNMKESLSKMLKEELSDITDYLEYYQYVFFAMLPFIVLWFILFLFSFFHLLASNKRFVMWYVKLLCWIPSIIWLALKLVPVIMEKVAPDALEGDTGSLVNTILNGVTSYTWINGLCYILLWLVSIVWAFPIKRKIRKERKYPEVEDSGEDFGSYSE